MFLRAFKKSFFSKNSIFPTLKRHLNNFGLKNSQICTKVALPNENNLNIQFCLIIFYGPF